MAGRVSEEDFPKAVKAVKEDSEERPREEKPRRMKIACDLQNTLVQPEPGEWVDDGLLIALVAAHNAGHEVYFFSTAPHDLKFLAEHAEDMGLVVRGGPDQFFQAHNKGDRAFIGEKGPFDVVLDDEDIGLWLDKNKGTKHLKTKTPAFERFKSIFIFRGVLALCREKGITPENLTADINRRIRAVGISGEFSVNAVESLIEGKPLTGMRDTQWALFLKHLVEVSGIDMGDATFASIGSYDHCVPKNL